MGPGSNLGFWRAERTKWRRQTLSPKKMPWWINSGSSETCSTFTSQPVEIKLGSWACRINAGWLEGSVEKLLKSVLIGADRTRWMFPSFQRSVLQSSDTKLPLLFPPHPQSLPSPKISTSTVLPLFCLLLLLTSPRPSPRWKNRSHSGQWRGKACFQVPLLNGSLCQDPWAINMTMWQCGGAF